MSCCGCCCNGTKDINLRPIIMKNKLIRRKIKCFNCGCTKLIYYKKSFKLQNLLTYCLKCKKDTVTVN